MIDSASSSDRDLEWADDDFEGSEDGSNSVGDDEEEENREPWFFTVVLGQLEYDIREVRFYGGRVELHSTNRFERVSLSASKFVTSINLRRTTGLKLLEFLKAQPDKWVDYDTLDRWGFLNAPPVTNIGRRIVENRSETVVRRLMYSDRLNGYRASEHERGTIGKWWSLDFYTLRVESALFQGGISALVLEEEKVVVQDEEQKRVVFRKKKGPLQGWNNLLKLDAACKENPSMIVKLDVPGSRNGDGSDTKRYFTDKFNFFHSTGAQCARMSVLNGMVALSTQNWSEAERLAAIEPMATRGFAGI